MLISKVKIKIVKDVLEYLQIVLYAFKIINLKTYKYTTILILNVSNHVTIIILLILAQIYANSVIFEYLRIFILMNILKVLLYVKNVNLMIIIVLIVIKIQLETNICNL